MSDKPVLFMDTDFVNDIFGRKNFDAARGTETLNALAGKYEIHITSTILQELNPGTEIENYKMQDEIRQSWFKNNPNVIIHNTPEYDELISDWNVTVNFISKEIETSFDEIESIIKECFFIYGAGYDPDFKTHDVFCNFEGVNRA
ncbi:MAG: hypothetical protein OEY94_06785 [Alphaproteobacteria bacterium]|nr:hypothetical protein [Alphaproteobacteria bacterium]